MFNAENDFIAISTLNDFIFCPYSIYLHNVFEGTDEDVFYALPQIKGKEAHSSVDSKSNSLGCRVIESLSVQSLKFGLFGKIDLFFLETGELVERKNILKNFYRSSISIMGTMYLHARDGICCKITILLRDYDKKKDIYKDT